ncbi:hypothetical protein [Zavarzinia sp. CC-PAN008]|uniref:hypothetical protein n=1 Tax=Zavarzinia sp. CC-PAN008 TaxID=3243332 RepID=UPI003F746A25
MSQPVPSHKMQNSAAVPPIAGATPPRQPIADAIPATTPRTSAGRVGLGLVLAMLALAILNSEGLVGWSRDLEPGPVADRILEGAEAWHGWMQALGPAAVRPWLRAGLHRLQGVEEDAGFGAEGFDAPIPQDVLDGSAPDSAPAGE